MRRAALCLLILISLCSGCSGRPAPTPEPAPVMVWPARCARPTKPDLPRLSGLEFLESLEGYARLKLRDTRLRAYLAGLEDALDCYDAQLPPKQEVR